MPPSRSYSSATTRAGVTRAAGDVRAERNGAASRAGRRTGPGVGRVRWERKLRTLMLCVLALIGYIGLKAALALIATHAQAQQETNLVSSLQRQNRALRQQQYQLNQPGTIISEARALGMVRAGEKPYVVTGLPQGG